MEGDMRGNIGGVGGGEGWWKLCKYCIMKL